MDCKMSDTYARCMIVISMMCCVWGYVRLFPSEIQHIVTKGLDILWNEGRVVFKITHHPEENADQHCIIEQCTSVLINQLRIEIIECIPDHPICWRIGIFRVIKSGPLLLSLAPYSSPCSNTQNSGCSLRVPWGFTLVCLCICSHFLEWASCLSIQGSTSHSSDDSVMLSLTPSKPSFLHQLAHCTTCYPSSEQFLLMSRIQSDGVRWSFLPPGFIHYSAPADSSSNGNDQSTYLTVRKDQVIYQILESLQYVFTTHIMLDCSCLFSVRCSLRPRSYLLPEIPELLAECLWRRPSKNIY